MKKTLQATFVFLLMAIMVMYSEPVFAEEETEFTAGTADSYGYSVDTWYNYDVNNALLCYSLMTDSSDLTDFLTNSEPENAYIINFNDDGLAFLVNIHDYSIFYSYVPGHDPAYRQIIDKNIDSQFVSMLLEGKETQHKAISDEGWSGMYELLGITKEDEDVVTLENTPEPIASEPTYLQKGSKGESVKAVQKRLIELGYLEGTADGEFGKKTETAVKDLQKAYSLDVTGIVTDVEIHAMNELPDIVASSQTETPEVITGNLTINNCSDLARILKSKDPNASIIKEFAEKYSGMTIEFDGNIAYMSNHGGYNTRYDILVHAGKYSESSALGPDFQFEDVGVIDLGLSGLYMTDLLSIGDKVHIIAVVGDYRESSGLFKLKPVSVIVK